MVDSVKHALVIVLSAALLFAAASDVWVRADTAGRAREEFTHELTERFDEKIAFYPSGTFGKRLMVVPEYADHAPGGQADCDELVDLLILDKKTMAELDHKGFTSIRCGIRDVAAATN
jgi:hypothetical protein